MKEVKKLAKAHGTHRGAHNGLLLLQTALYTEEVRAVRPQKYLSPLRRSQ
jgi:hypothetical protein